MRIEEIKKLAHGTADAAYVLDSQGQIVSWNAAAEALFGVTEGEAVGKACSATLKGIDECGHECGADCSILKRANCRDPLKNYDIKTRVSGREIWCNVSVVILDRSSSINTYTLHIIRPTDVQKRLELAVKDFVLAETSLPEANVREILSTKRSPTASVDLTARETEVLRLLAAGNTTERISDELSISKATTNNHIQHVMKKLSAHSRLEAIRRAEQAGLV
ncbi:MAG: LuxR C-terminal-related transcriptional regulator [bacterium]|nr:LuxR C-terminal-related transcriptional regulator [bacterium]